MRVVTSVLLVAVLGAACAALPDPVENEWARVETARLVRGSLEDGRLALRYVVGIEPKRADLACVDVLDVSGLDPVTLVSGAEIGGDNEWSSAPIPISPQTLPWLYTSGPTRKLLRFVIYDERGETAVLEQPVTFPVEIKARLRKLAETPQRGS